MKLKVITGIWLTLFLASMLALAHAHLVAGETLVGVKAGDWIKYDYTVAGAPAGEFLPTWIKVEFLGVEGANVTVSVTEHMSNGTEYNDIMTVDVETGEGTFFSGFLIPANCTTGDSVHLDGYGNVTIDGETTGTYVKTDRTVVYGTLREFDVPLTYYWDKQTGVMVEASITSVGFIATLKAIETNMWEAASFWVQWWFWGIVAVAIAVLAGVVYFLMKKRKPPIPTTSALPREGTLHSHLLPTNRGRFRVRD